MQINALALGVAYREYGFTDGYRSVRDAAIDTALAGFLLAVTAPLGYVMIAERIPQHIVSAAAAFTQEPLVLLLILNLLLLVAGMFLDLAASVLIVVPLALPGDGGRIDPIHFAWS
jgi:TRAP-type C4-dicarboxylate transport system permease large subunit